MASNSIDTENLSLSDLFDLAWNLQKDIEKNLDNSNRNDLKFKEDLHKAISYLEKCDYMLDELALFSENETIDEVSTSELRYFVHSALLAWLIAKEPYNAKTRLETLIKAKNYYLKYLNLTKSYSFHNYKLQTNDNHTLDVQPKQAITTQAAFDKNILDMAYERNEKIKRYKEQKEFEKRLELMEIACSRPHVDDEQRREYYMTAISFWLNRSIEDYKFVLDELQLVRRMNSEDAEQLEEKYAQKPKREPIKPYIITRDMIQAKVIGEGYPSLPTYSVEEFYDQLAGKGYMPEAGHGHDSNQPVQIGGGVTESQKEDDKIAKEVLEDDEEEIKKQREWDEWKDDNKRGAGNRYNRS